MYGSVIGSQKPISPTTPKAPTSMYAIPSAIRVRDTHKSDLKELGIEKGSKVVGGLPWLRLGCSIHLGGLEHSAMVCPRLSTSSAT